ncbi:hypothetical protein RintRC_7377 [Richelia intracellularis]|nr:hypothetical protein RintRC_7377 [Richelia intracellularis]
MKVLVIGGTNFIGPHVVRYLLAFGHSVIFHWGKTIASSNRIFPPISASLLVRSLCWMK